MDAFVKQVSSEFQWANRPGLVAHIMAINHFVQKDTMDKLLGSRRYRRLSLAYVGYISRLAEQDHTPGDLASKLGISRQACSKIIAELEQLQLVERRVNPADSRSSLLSLAPQGRQLLADGMRVTAALQQRFVGAIGADTAQRLATILDKLCRKLGVAVPRIPALKGPGRKGGGQLRLHALLPGLSDFCYQTLIDSLGAKGFKGLKPSFSQVLSLVILDGGRIPYIASVIGVSKQAIAATAVELEQLGYITREPDPDDRRQVILRLSRRGQRLLTEANASVESLEASIRDALDEDEFELLAQAMSTLYVDGIDHYGSQDVQPAVIRQLAQDLVADIGIAGARMLAQQLTIITRGKA